MNKDIKPRNAKGERHGLWELYYVNDHLCNKCIFINGKKNGFDELYWNDDGKVTHKRYYL